MSTESDMDAEMNILYALRRGERPKVEKPDNFVGVRAVTSWAPDYPIALVPEEEKAAVAALAMFAALPPEERTDPRNWPSPRHLAWALAKLRMTRDLAASQTQGMADDLAREEREHRATRDAHERRSSWEDENSVNLGPVRITRIWGQP